MISRHHHMASIDRIDDSNLNNITRGTHATLALFFIDLCCISTCA